VEIAIRPVRPDEAERFVVVAEMAFGKDAQGADRFAQLLETDRALFACDGDQPVGASAVLSFRVTVPGGELPAAAVTAVGVLPTHRRRGILTRLMHAMLADARGRGEPLAVLWSSEATIYGRFGFGDAVPCGDVEVERAHARLRTDPVPARARLVPLAAAADVLPGVYDRVRVATPGMLARSERWWRLHRLADDETARGGAGPLVAAVVELDGRPEGYALYRIEHDWGEGVSRAVLDVREAMGTTPAATRAVWEFLFGIDLVARVRASFLPLDHPLRFAVAEPRRLRMRVGDSLWVRLVDVDAALAGRRYGADGTLVLDVADDFCPWNTGRRRLEVHGGRGRVEPTEEPADLALDCAELGALYLGGVDPGALVRAGLVDELREGAAERAARLFRAERAPWCAEIF
jgi:predicted acetyltransferase